ncbi:ABC transporter substrate-binding protein [Paenibacillus rigui]|uniref:Myristoyl transferase n=1 Tax=Paenibacillus rigui TaxID=554312 RepID=A0A229URF3_9BACL|nr:ABC transporter substrate-binding protein [Paenibacillus rigui]OXM85831.1 myristoyl transferase [Paenibacillus rigui]
MWRETRKRRKAAYGLTIALLLCFIVGCSPGAPQAASKETPKEAASGTKGESVPASTVKPPVPVKLITAWFAKGNDGGLFAALQQNYYKDNGIDITLQSGGPGISALQIVSSGKADFGISYADDILKAREQGIPVVGLMTTFQVDPRVLIFHKGNNISKFEDINGKKLFVSSGVMYWEYVRNKYHLDKVNQINYTGQLANFISDKDSLNQGYISNEPFVLKKQGVDVSYLKIADSGYANYANILFTTEKYIAEHPDVVEAVVKASQKGWNYYNDNYETVNPLIHQYNPDLPVENLNNEAKTQKELIVSGDAATHGVGYMTQERWTTLQGQLLELGILKEKQDVTKMFTTKFLQTK